MVLKQQRSRMKRVLLLIGMCFLLGTWVTVFFQQRWTYENAVKSHLALWETDVASALLDQRADDFLKKIVSHIENFGVENYRLLFRGKEVLKNSKDAFNENCQWGLNVPITVHGLPVANLEACQSTFFLAQVTLSSPFFLLTLLFGLMLITLSSLWPLRSYKKALNESLQVLTRWSKRVENRLDASEFDLTGRDPVTQSLVGLVKSGVEQKVKSERLQGELERSQEVGRISRQVAHDIRSPLMALKTLSGVTEWQEEQKHLLKRVILRVQSIADDLMDKGRKMTEGRRTSSLREVLQEIIQEKELNLGAAIQFEFQQEILEKSQALSISNERELGRVLSNLINNSVEASKPAVTTIRLALESERDQCWSLSITDQGCGIPSEILPQVLEEGFSHKKNHGSGLGLFHAKTVIESMQGELRISSQEGVGTKVEITLPHRV